MIGTITYILARAGWRAMNGTIADERRRLAGAEPPAAYVSYDPRLLAGVGWYGYRIAFNGGDLQMIERARYMLSERYTIRDSYEYYADGVYVIGVLLRQRVPHYGIGGGAPTPEPDALNFYMPNGGAPTPEPDALNFYMPNGGTISLNKIGSPTVVELEYSLDKGKTWTVWQPDNYGNRSITLTAGQRVYIRNTSETQTRFSIYTDNYYKFVLSEEVYANGDVRSLKCKNPNNAVIDYGCFISLFEGCTYLKTPPKISDTEITVEIICFYRMFADCSNLLYIPKLNFREANPYSCYSMFHSCSSLTEADISVIEKANNNAMGYMFELCSSLNVIKISINTITDNTSLFKWVNNVSPTGDFYCPAELTIPTGASGIPSGWTRHDI